MEVFLLRHAETETNRDGALAAGNEDALSRYGRFQAQSIIEGLMELDIEGIISSPYHRALETIRPFAEATGKNVEVHPCLSEGQLILAESPPQEQPKYFHHESGHHYPAEDESAGAFLGRVTHAQEIIRSQPFDRILVVTHGHMLRELLNRMLELTERTRFPHDNCGLTHVSLGESNMVNYINRPMCSNLGVRQP